jgi:hypothetical protein
MQKSCNRPQEKTEREGVGHLLVKISTKRYVSQGLERIRDYRNNQTLKEIITKTSTNK